MQIDLNDVAQQYKLELAASVDRNVILAAAYGAAERRLEAVTKERDDLKKELEEAKKPKEQAPE